MSITQEAELIGMQRASEAVAYTLQEAVHQGLPAGMPPSSIGAFASWRLCVKQKGEVILCALLNIVSGRK
jgi:hypothetical protein